MKAIDLAGFSAKFAADADPWRTFSNRDEAVKRQAIMHAFGPGPHGQVLELASGNGSNSIAIARRVLRLDATEGTPEGVALTAAVLAGERGARAHLLRLPARFPHSRYDAILVAELLYYLTAREMKLLARDVETALRSGGKLILAHHRIQFHDFAQPAKDIQLRFLAATSRSWIVRMTRQTSRWQALVAY